MLKKVSKKALPYLLVFLQFLGLFTIMFSGPLFARGYPLLFLQIMAILLGTWAVLVMKIGHFNIIPIPQKKAVLVSSGPYSILRHPMYSSIILFTLAEIINEYSLFRLLVFLGLCLALIWKLHYEENQLLLKFESYSDYQKKSYKIIPYLY